MQLLERLPWPLMLQTGTGEVVTQNPAWWQQLGVVKDPEGVRQQVEAILAPSQTVQPKYAHQKTVPISPHSRGNGQEREEQSIPLKLHPGEHTLSVRNEALQSSPAATPLIKDLHDQSATAASGVRCFLDGQVGTCTCVVEVQNGQERVWQFAKIPLDSPELKILSNDSDILFSAQGSEVSTDLWLVLATDVTERKY